MEPFRPMIFDNRPVAPVFLDSNPVTDGVANFAAALMNAGPAANQIRQQREAVELGRLWKEREWERQTQQDKLAALWHQQAQERQAENDARMGKLTDAQIANLEADNTRANLMGLSSEGRGWVDSVGKLFGGHGRAGAAKEQKKTDVLKTYNDLKKNYPEEPDNKKMIQDLESFGDNLTQEQIDLLNWLKSQQTAQVEQKQGETGWIDAGVWGGARAQELAEAAQVSNAVKNVATAVPKVLNAPFSGINVAEKVIDAGKTGRPFLSGPKNGWFGLAKEGVKDGAKVGSLFSRIAPIARFAASPFMTLANGAMAVGDLVSGDRVTGNGTAVGNMVAAGIKAANRDMVPENKEATLNIWASKTEKVNPSQLWGSLVANGMIPRDLASKENMNYFMNEIKTADEETTMNPLARRNFIKLTIQDMVGKNKKGTKINADMSKKTAIENQNNGFDPDLEKRIVNMNEEQLKDYLFSLKNR
jgi:hypothetical protein